ncbi:hypothetical protein tb265_22430 [Gemmatimonadetes bacterium T265]|nr:hypothetical protein tb265_22430 [Gemmatimonadetes bacterium T265]
MTPTPEPPTPEARRVPGPNLYAAVPGAVVEATWPADTAREVLDRHVGAWRREAFRLRDGLGWRASTAVERASVGASGVHLALFLAAPPDQLDAAVLVVEAAWAAAVAGAPTDAAAALDAAAAAEREPRLVALVDAAEARGLVATVDDDGVSVGAGARSRTWARDALPDVGDAGCATLGNVPVGLVTGSNGKTTVTRAAAAILRAAGHTVGVSTTDGVRVDGPGEGDDAAHEALEAGDWAGPGGARRVLRDRRVTAAVLETARGGILRRGLAVRRASAAVVTNVAADHLGEYGIDDLDAVAEVKLVVARALRGADATLVVAADDAALVRRVAKLAREAPFQVCWTSADAGADAAARTAAALARGDRACVVRASDAGEVLAYHDGAAWHALARVNEVPIAAGGAARHNVANAASAAALALALGTPLAAVRAGLRAFGAGARDNPGRLERFAAGGVTVVVDYAHNPDGLAALHAATRAWPAERRLLLLGQAGDRDDAALDALAAAAWGGGRVDRVVLKELPTMWRGRAPGEVPARLREALRRAGAPDDAVADAPSEVDGVRAALAWARAGDLLLLPLHESREAVVRWLEALARAGWRAGEPLPNGPLADGPGAEPG